jgi:hypothetical protein
VAALLVAAPAAADDHPTDRQLVGVGLAMAVPDYLLGVALHEGSHAVAAELVGGDVTDIHLWPGRNPYNGAFQFGWTRVRGVQGRRQKMFFLMAPRVTDLVLLGGYGLLRTLEAPDNDWAQLALQVFATGLVVDFTKDLFLWSPFNDVIRFYDLCGLDREWKRFPLRIVHAAASAGLGYMVWLGWRDLFAENNNGAVAAPLVSGSF